MSELFENLLTSSPFAIIELFELQLETAIHGSNETHRFFSGVNQKTTTGQIVFGGNTYIALPVEADGFEFKGDGTLPRPTLRIANTNSFVSAVLLSVNETTPGNDLTGAKFTRIRTLSRFLDAENFDNNANPYGTPDPTEATGQMPKEVYYVDRKVSENRDLVEFELASVFDLEGVTAPRRLALDNICQWTYRGPECGYQGTEFTENDVVEITEGAPNLTFTTGANQLTARNSLYEGQELVSSNGWYRLRVQPDGNLVIYDKAGTVIWTHGQGVRSPQGNGRYELRMQGDGNLVMYDRDTNAVVWSGQDTHLKGAATGLSFTAFYPADIQEGRRGAFSYEVNGRVANSTSDTNTVQKTYTLGTRTLTVSLAFTADALPSDHFSGQSYVWSIPTVTFVSSTGLFTPDETVNLNETTDSNNPFRNTSYNTLTTVGIAVQVTGTTGFTNNIAQLGNAGKLKVIVTDVNNTEIDMNGVYISAEPTITTTTNLPAENTCGKRLTSCQRRFPTGDQYGGLPFGSFPSLGRNIG
nr:putative phage minor tail protein L [uncultured Mediterranean phage uvMED]